MIDATYLKTHPTTSACGLKSRPGAADRPYQRRYKHQVAHRQRCRHFSMTAGQVGNYTGATALLDDLPKAQWLLGDRAMTPTG
jgi:hypothetical protein